MPDEVEAFRDISFSWNTVFERVDEMASNLNEQLLTKIKVLLHFPLQLMKVWMFVFWHS